MPSFSLNFMSSPFSWVFAVLLTLLSSPTRGGDVPDILPRINAACAAIEKQISSASKVYYLASTNYVTGNKHYFSSSSQASACVVEVGSNDDTSKVIKIIGSNRSPFAIIAGGHASNPGFSSTPGVLISMVRFKTFKPAADRKSIVLGTGNIWTKDVYPKADQLGYNVVGGRVTGPAVGGVTLGGGFSWLTNQYGLTCDTIKSFTLVLPNGTISQIGPQQQDLFFALKGGLNRFGIVTEITYNLYPQVPKVYGGYQTFAATSFPALVKATADFSNTNKDPKAQIILTTAYLASVPTAVLLLFYDGPTVPPSLAPFQKIPYLTSDVSSRSFPNFAQSAPSELSSGPRGAFHTFSTTGYTEKFLNAVLNETTFYGALAALHTGVFISYDIEPFLNTYGRKATDSAYPHGNSPLPLNLDFAWLSPTEDAFWRGKLQTSVDTLIAVARSEGIYDESSTAYPNYALSTYNGDKLYGSANAARLRRIKASVDPNRVMDLTGGFTL